MKRSRLLIACCVLGSAVMIAAQDRQAAADPISGTWTGDYGTNETERIPVTFELKFDGSSTVSGTVIANQNALPIKRGTFDPKTGVLTLEGEAEGRDGAMTPYFVEGKVDKSTLAGRWTFDDDEGDFKVTKK
jgi:hypothetical protein